GCWCGAGEAYGTCHGA
ncbi:SEC-C metal-binding domain-containing protein, partial [Streptomyces tricolor]